MKLIFGMEPSSMCLQSFLIMGFIFLSLLYKPCLLNLVFLDTVIEILVWLLMLFGFMAVILVYKVSRGGNC